MKLVSRFLVVALAVVLLFAGFWVALEPTTAQADGCCQSQCRGDRHCDTICGAKGAGVCIMVNSCCRQCACLF